MNTRPPRLLALSVGFLSATAAAAVAEVTLVSDDFSEVRVSETDSAQTLLSSGYTYRQHVHSNLFENSGGGALAFSSKNNSIGYLNFTPVVLKQAGESITLSFTVTFIEGAIDSNAGFRCGLYDTFGDINTALAYKEGGNPVGDSAQGYYVTTNPGATGEIWTAGSTGLNKDLGNQTTANYNSVNGGQGTRALVSIPSAIKWANNPQLVTLKITKTPEGVLIEGSVAGEAFSKNDNSAAYVSFDTFFFGNGASSGPWIMDDLRVTTTGNLLPGSARWR